MKRRKNANVTRETAAENAKKQIAAAVLIGLLLLITDLVISASKADVAVIESGGQLYIMRPQEGQAPGQLFLKATVTGKNADVEKKIGVTIKPYSSEKKEDTVKADEENSSSAEREQIEFGIRSAVSDLNSDRQTGKVKLPGRLETGEKISWEVQQGASSNAPAISALTVIIAFCIYKNRFAVIERQRKRECESVIRQLPEFVNRLVLLLNAGLVLTSAFEKSVEESLDADNDGGYFFGKLKDIYVRCKTANGVMHNELKDLARECGVRELMRVSNIISDNIKKGVELTDKLQAESEILWMSRKKACEEKGRLAETKLTLPLMIFLLVLIVITVAPALLEL